MVGVNGGGAMEGLMWSTVGMLNCWCWGSFGEREGNEVAFVFTTAILPMLLQSWQWVGMEAPGKAA